LPFSSAGRSPHGDLLEDVEGRAAITAAEMVRLSSMLPPLRNINLLKLENLTMMIGNE
jgi:hypothetical protein